MATKDLTALAVIRIGRMRTAIELHAKNASSWQDFEDSINSDAEITKLRKQLPGFVLTILMNEFAHLID